MRQRIELITSADVERFTDIANTIEEDVTLIGKDENGKDWTVSAKSFLASLFIVDGTRKCSGHNLDWNTLEVECDRDIYFLIKEFVVGGSLE